MNKKILSKKQAEKIAKTLRRQGKKIIFTNGCFDLLHVGHIRYLKKAKSLGDKLMVGLNTDRSVHALKGKNRPLVQESERAEMLSSLEMVDYVIPFSEKRPDQLIQQIRPDIHVKGGDYDKDALPEAPLVLALGGQVKILPLVRGKSTTDLIRRIQKLT